MQYLSFNPTIEYDGQTLVDLMVRAKIRDAIKKNTVVYYPWTVTDDMRPDIVAHKYYGSSKYTWLIFLANDMINPIFDWPLTYKEFIAYINDKYGSYQSAQTTNKYYLNAQNRIIDYTTYLSLDEDDRDTISVYDWEYQKNEAKREIKLIDNVFLGQIVQEMYRLFKT